MNKFDEAYFSGGCFWCTEAIFQRVRGVLTVIPGYMGGHTSNPKYEDVILGNTGHSEGVQIKFNSSLIKYKELVYLFFLSHDPTTLNRQGNDIGTQYKSVVFFNNIDQLKTLNIVIKELNDENVYNNPIITEIKEFKKFYVSENQHHNYYNLNKEKSYCENVITPKLNRIKKNFEHLMKNN